jgi:hypothetical protein
VLVTFCLVDDWYQRKGARLLRCTVGSKPKFSDSEMLTLTLAIDFFAGWISPRLIYSRIAFLEHKSSINLTYPPELIDQLDFHLIHKYTYE